MLIFGFPLTIVLGVLAALCFAITFIMGVLFHYLHRPVFRYHKLFALLTAIIIIAHATLVIFYRL